MSPAALRHGGLFPPDCGSKRTGAPCLPAGTASAGRKPAREPDRAVVTLDFSTFAGRARAATLPSLLVTRLSGPTTLAILP
jgi:hypothetical protein